MNYEVLIGDCRTSMKKIPDESIDMCITSPPYWNLRDYQNEEQLGLEKTPEEYVQNMVEVFRIVRQKLKPSGTLWLNLGDSYAGGGGSSGHTAEGKVPLGLKPKDLVGIPWAVAFALRADGWWLRQDIVWAKPNPMPEPVKDRCTRSHEFVFMFSKKKKYYYDNDAIREPIGESMRRSIKNGPRVTEGYKHDEETRMGKSSGNHAFSRQESLDNIAKGRNKRDVWFIAAKPYSGAHFAVFPPELVEPCILAGCPAGGIVLDPFGGSGTTAGVAILHGRSSILCELSEDYISLIDDRVSMISGGFRRGQTTIFDF